MLAGRVLQDYCLHAFAEKAFAFSQVRKDGREKEGSAEGQESHNTICRTGHLIGILLAWCRPEQIELQCCQNQGSHTAFI